MMASECSANMAARDLFPLNAVSFNLHGFHQGHSVIEDLLLCGCPDVFMLQEHWLTPDNLCKFDM